MIRTVCLEVLSLLPSSVLVLIMSLTVRSAGEGLRIRNRVLNKNNIPHHYYLFQLIWLLPRISSTRSLSLVGLEYGCQASALNMMPCPNLLELDLRYG